jgi:hypothetical protein
MNIKAGMGQIKEEDDINPNDAKYAGQPLDLNHLPKISQATLSSPKNKKMNVISEV